MFEEEIKKEIIRYTSASIEWAAEKFNLPLLILFLNYTFSKQNTRSWVKGNFLQFEMFLSLHNILEAAISNKKIIFNQESYFRNHIILKDFEATWNEYLQHLIYHEMAHIFDNTSFYDQHIKTTICQTYQFKNKPSTRRKHHGALWKKIYLDLKVDSPSTFDHSKILCLSENKKYNFYFKKA